ncbi:MAG: UDP-2,3-diacylglucosamine diphosphatase LpxI [Verrucomicrobiae bacterium]|nr:UDP-2,3-diacylglucosamine diphosphatase LpxI [Verrucomicrobiae bacterium]
MDSFGIVAGSGTYPLLMAREARKQGVKTIVATGFKDETDPEIEKVADAVEWLRVGEMNRLIRTFTSRGVREVAMVGAVGLKNLFDMRPDFRTLKALLLLRERNAATLFGAVVREMEKDGLKVVEATRFLEHLLPPAGLIAGPKPKSRQMSDIAWGAKIAKQIAALNIGQCIVVRNGTVLAVEAYESTSETILRGGKAGREQAIVIKVAKPDHDFRFDVPVMGLKTMEMAREGGIAVLAVEARRTLLLDLEPMKEFAARHKISLLAFDTSP